MSVKTAPPETISNATSAAQAVTTEGDTNAKRVRTSLPDVGPGNPKLISCLLGNEIYLTARLLNQFNLTGCVLYAAAMAVEARGDVGNNRYITVAAAPNEGGNYWLNAK